MISSKGKQAQQKALGIVKSKRTNKKENNHKKSVPELHKLTCHADINGAINLSEGSGASG